MTLREERVNLAILVTYCENKPQGNSLIAVNGDEKADLENIKLYQKASRSDRRHSLNLKQFCKVHVVRHNLLYLHKYNLHLFI